MHAQFGDYASVLIFASESQKFHDLMHAETTGKKASTHTHTYTAISNRTSSSNSSSGATSVILCTAEGYVCALLTAR